MDKKKLLILGGSVIGFTVLFTLGFLYLFKGKSNNDKKINDNNKQSVKEVNNICTLNLVYFYPDKIQLLENSLKQYKIKFNRKEDLNNNIVVDCTLKKKDKQIIQIINKPGYLLRDYLVYGLSENEKENKYQLSITNVNLQKIKNNLINVIKIDKNLKNTYRYFSNDPNIILFNNILKKINKDITLGLNLDIEKIKGFKKIKYNKILNKYGKDIIITNTKIIVKLLPDDFTILKKKLEQLKLGNKVKTIEKLEKLSKMYTNTIVYDGKYIIIQNINKLIEAYKKK